jgi:hypothetical protein
MWKLVVLALFTLGLVATPVGDEGPEGRHCPPQVAFDACQSTAAGNACQVSMPDRTLTGTCSATPEGGLACRPDLPPGPRPR